VYIVAIISIVIISFMAYNIYQMEMKKSEEAKTAAMTEFKEYKNEVINNIKNIYGKYYYESPYAQSIVGKIKMATSREEIEKILKESNINEDAKKYYIKGIKNKIDPNGYYVVPVFKEKRLMKGSEIVDYIKKLSFMDIKNLSEEIETVSFNKVAIVVSATQCGKIPLEGSKIEIYDKNNVGRKPIQGVVDSSYVIVNSINYKESKSVSNIFTEDKDISELSSTSDIEYSLENVPGILYATAAEKLDYYKVISKFGRYGERVNKITSDTQIFDENAKYLLIVSVPSTDIPGLLSIKSNDLYIVVLE